MGTHKIKAIGEKLLSGMVGPQERQKKEEEEVSEIPWKSDLGLMMVGCSGLCVVLRKADSHQDAGRSTTQMQ